MQSIQNNQFDKHDVGIQFLHKIEVSRVQEFEDRIREVNLSGNPIDAQLERKRIADEQFLAGQNPLIMRNLYIIVDATKSAKINDFKPSRLSIALKYLGQFVPRFLEGNPLSQIGIGVAIDGSCKHVLDFTSSNHNLENYLGTIKSGNEAAFSLSACLQTSLNIFSQTQLHTVSTILLLSSSPYTHDAIDLAEQINLCLQAKIRFNVISFCGIVQKIKSLCEVTEGLHYSPLDEFDFQRLLNSFVIPSYQTQPINQLVRLGFPSKSIDSLPTLCTCHLSLIYDYYKCPRCLSKVCNPPLMCPQCQIWIVLPFQILRQDNHLDIFQLSDYKGCYACNSDSTTSQCPSCDNRFCIDCDILIHTLRVCPGCA